MIRGVFFTSKELFPNAALKKLILPLVIEQVLAITVGLADTMMVSSVGEAAVSGVSLVDMLNVLIINIFSALATGGAVVVAQLLGARKNDRACDASKQLYLVVTVIALIISTLVMLFRAPLLRLLFGTGGSALLRGILCKHQFHGLCPPLCASSIPRRGVAHHTTFLHSGKILFYFQESFIRLHPYGIIKLQY